MCDPPAWGLGEVPTMPPREKPLLRNIKKCSQGEMLPRHMARMGEGRGVHRVLVGKPEGKRTLERPRRRWEDDIKKDLREVGGGGDWMELAQGRDRWWALVNKVMKFRVP